jgi:hypothetical protein
MAPEQCRGEPLDGRVDIYACGIVLFEMLTGKKPLTAADPIATVKKQISEQPPRLADVTPGDYGALEEVVARALAKKPEDRYPSAVAMAEALDAAVSGRVTAEPTMAFAPIKDDYVTELNESTADVPITVGSSVHVKPEPPGSSIRRQLPVSRTRWFVLAALLAVGAGAAFVIVNRDQLFGATEPARPDATYTRVVDVPVPAPAPAPPPAPLDPASELAAQAKKLVEAGNTQAAIDALGKARKVYPNSALLAVTLGKLYMEKMWWADGLVHLRDAVKLDPSLKNDEELIKLVLGGYLMTPGYDYRLANFLIELGPSAAPLLEETARTHPNASKRARADALLRRIKK